MSSIDTRIVEMSFDNKQFEEGVDTTISSLKNLDKKIRESSTKDSFEGLERAASSVSFDRLYNNIEKIANRFSIWGIAVETTIRSAVQSAERYLKNFIKSFTTDPIASGFDEYQTQIDATQTIMSNTSWEIEDDVERLEKVNSALSTLNTYADKTIYNFTEMTRNIGTFTAAGVGLQDSTDAIQGISNLAAVSGSTSQQASTAMYQLSQAMSSGVVKAQDWNSVVNAGMGGKMFQDALVATASAMGVTVEKTVTEIGKNGKTTKKKVKKTVQELINEGSFRESLSEGWLSKDVLLNTLKQFSGVYTEANKAELIAMGFTEDQVVQIIKMGEDATEAATKVKTVRQLMDTLKESAQSGWTQSWQIIVGDFAEAKELLTKVSDYFGGLIQQSSDARNAILQGWKDGGGRDKIIKAFWDMAEAIEKIGSVAKNVFNSVLPKITSDTLVDISTKIGEFAGKFKDFFSDTDNIEKVRRIFEGIAAPFKLLKTLTSEIYNKGFALFSAIIPDAESTLDLLANLGDVLVSIVDALMSNGTVKEIFAQLWDVLKSAFDIFANVYKKIYKLVKSSGLLKNVGDNFAKLIKPISSFLSWLHKLGSDFSDFLKNTEIGKKIVDKVKTAFKTISNAVQKATEKISKFFGTLFGKEKKTSAATADDEENIFVKLITKLINIGQRIKASAQKLVSFLHLDDLFNAIKGTVENLWIKLSNLLPDDFSFIDWLSSIPEKLSQVFSRIGKSFQTAGINISLSSILDSLKNLSINLGNLIHSLLSSGVEGGKNGLSYIAEKVKGFFVAIANFFTDTSTDAGLEETKRRVQKISDNTLTIYDIIKPFGDFLKNVFVSPFTAIAEALNKLPTKKILALSSAISEIIIALGIFRGGRGLSKAGKGIESFGEAFGKIADVVDSLRGSPERLVEGLKSILKDGFEIRHTEKKIDAIGTTLLKIAGSIALVVASLWLLSTMKESDTKRALVTIGVVAAIIAALGAFSKFVLGKDSTAGSNLKGIAVSIAIIASIIYLITLIPQTMFLTGLERVGLMILVFGGLITAMSIINGKMGGSGFDTSKSKFISMAVAIGILSLCVAGLAKIKPLALARGVVAVFVLGTVLGALAVVIGKYGSYSNGAKPRGLIAMSIAIGILALCVAGLAAIPPSDMWRGVAAVSILGIVLAGLVLAVGAASKWAGSGKRVLAVVASTILGIVALVWAVLSLKDVPFSRLAEIIGSITVALVGVFLAIAGSARLAGKGGGTRAFVEAIGAVLAIAALVAAILLLKDVPEEQIKTICISLGAALSALFLSIGGAVRLAGHNILGTIGIVLVLVLSLVAVCAALKFISDNDIKWETIAALCGGVSVLALAIAGACKLAGAGAGSTLLGAAVLAGALLLIGLGIAAFAMLAGSAMDSFSTGIFKLGANLDLAKTAAEGIDGDTFQPMIDAVESLVTLATSLLTVNTSGIDSFGTAITNLGARLNLFSTLTSNISGDTSNVTSVIEGISSISTTFADLAERNIDIEKLTNSLVNIGAAINLYSTLVGDGTIAPELLAGSDKEIDASKVKTLFDNLSENIPDESTIEKVASFAEGGGNDLTNFSLGLTALGGALNSYKDSVEGLDGDADITAAENVLDSISRLKSKLANEGKQIDLLGWWNGKGTTLQEFSENIVLLGGGLKSFKDSVAGISGISVDSDGTEKTVDDVSSALSVVDTLVEMEDKLTKNGGVLQWLSGSKDFGAFATRINQLGIGLKAYYDSVKMVDSGTLGSLTSPIKALASIETTLDDSGGFLQIVMGSSNIGTLGENLKNFGTGFLAFCKIMQEADDDGFKIDPDAIQNMITLCFDPLVGLEERMSAIPSSGFNLEDLIDHLGDNKTRLTNIVEFFDSVKTKDFTAAAKGFVDNVITPLITVESSLNGLNTEGFRLKDLLFDLGYNYGTATDPASLTNIATFFTELADNNVGEAAKNFVDDVIVPLVNVETSLSGIKNPGMRLKDLLYDLGSQNEQMTNFNNFIKTLSDNGTSTVMSDFVANVIDPLAAIEVKLAAIKRDDFNLSDLFDHIGSIDSAASIEALATLISSMINSVNELHYQWVATGEYSMSGFATGIRNKQSLVTSTAIAVAKSAYLAAQRTLRIGSPSKAFAEVGMYSDMGWAQGMNRYGYMVEASVEDTADNTLFLAHDLMSSLAYLMSDMDSAPTIRPVLDTTEIQNGFDTMDGMFGNRSLSLGINEASRTARNMASWMNDGHQVTLHTDNSDVVNAINVLSQNFNQLSDAVSNMQMVLDTNTVVGRLSPKIDKRLGVLASQRGRGN